MRSRTCLIFGRVLSLLLLWTIDFASAASCVSPVAACREWVNVDSGTARTQVYRNHSLDAANESVTHAIIVVHGQGRDADNYYRHILAAAFLADALERTLIVAPRFTSNEGRSCRDTVSSGELNWVCSGPHSWRSGGAAVGRNDVTSF